MFTKNQDISQLFKLTSPSYDQDEIRKLIEECDNYTQAVATPLSDLLTATNQFLSATTLEPFFRNLRNRSKTESELLLTLNAVADAFEKTNALAKHETAINASILQEGMIYSINCIQLRIHELKSAKDKIYDLIQQDKSDQFTQLIKNRLTADIKKHS